MMYSSVLKILRISFLFSRTQNLPFNRIYIFDELSGDVLNINGKAYENYTEQPIQNAIMRIGTFRDSLPFETLLWTNLQFILKFRSQAFLIRNHKQGDHLIELEFVNTVLSAVVMDENMHTLPTLNTNHYNMFIKRPDQRMSSTFFIDVFDNNVWSAVLGMLIIVVIMSIIYNLIQIRNEIDIMGTLYMIVGVSNENIKILFAIKYAQFIFGIFMMLIMTAFSTFLLSELAIVLLKLPFNTLDDVLRQDVYTICVPYDSYTLKFDAKKIFNKENCPYDNSVDYDYVASMCNREHTVYLSVLSEVFFYHIIRSKKPECSIYKFKGMHYSHSATIRLSNGFNYDDQLHRALLKIRTSGILKHDLDNIMQINEVNFFYHTNTGENNELVPVELDHVILILLVYFMLLLFCGILLLIEIIFKRFN